MRLRGSSARSTQRLGALGLLVVAVLVGCTTPEPTPEVVPEVVTIRVDRLVSTGDGSARQVLDQIDGRRRNATTSGVSGKDMAPSSTSVDASPPDPSAATITVDAEQRRQVIDGFGAALTDSSASLLMALPPAERKAALRALYDPAGPTGLSIVRLVVGASDFARSRYTYDDSLAPDPTLSGFSIERDREAIIPLAQEILRINPSVRFIASPWSAPAWMKTTGRLQSGGLQRRYEEVYARYLVKFLEAYDAAGIPVQYLTVQNEPLFEPHSYLGMLMPADQQARLIGQHLGPALAAAGLDTQVFVYDHNWDHPEYPVQVLKDEAVAAVSAGVAFHCYSADVVEAQERIRKEFGASARIWQTECTGGGFQGTRADAFRLTSKLVVGGLQHWGSASLLWNLALDPEHGPHTGGCGDCRGVIEVDGARWQPELDLDVLAGVSRWATPGSVAVQSKASGPGASSLQVAAVRTDREQLVLVVANPGKAQRGVTIRAGSVTIRTDLRAGSLTTLRWTV